MLRRDRKLNNITLGQSRDVVRSEEHDDAGNDEGSRALNVSYPDEVASLDSWYVPKDQRRAARYPPS